MSGFIVDFGVREVSKASISLPRKYYVPRVNMNQTKRLDNYWTQNLNEDWTELWKEIKRIQQCLRRVLNELIKSMRDSDANEMITLKSQAEWADGNDDQDTDVLHLYSPQHYFGQAPLPNSFKQDKSSSVLVMWMETLAMIKLLQDNYAKLKGGGIRNLRLTMWNIAVLYTTYQMFLIFVIWIFISDEQVKNHIADTCYCNNGEILNCRFIAKLLKEVDYRSEVDECKKTDEIYLRSHAKEIQSRQILQSSFSASITCAESFPSQPKERFVYRMYPYMENGDNPGNNNLENSAKNMYLKGQEFDFVQTNTCIRTCCFSQVASALHYLHNHSFRAPNIHEATSFDRVSLAEYFDMIIGDFGAVEAIYIQDTNCAKWTTIQGTNDYDLCNMSLHTYNVSNTLLVGAYSDTACYLQSMKAQEWLRTAIYGTETPAWLLTLAPKSCDQSVALIVKTWLDCSVVMEDRTWLDCSVVMKDRTWLDCSVVMKDRTWLDCSVVMKDRTWLDCSVVMEDRTWLDCSVVMKDRTWLDCSVVMEDRTWLDCSVVMKDRTWLDCSVVMKDRTWLDCSVIMKDRTWLDCSVDMKDRTWLDCSVIMKDRTWFDCSVVMKDRTWLDCSVIMKDRTWLDCSVVMEDRTWLDCSVVMKDRTWLDCSVIMKDRTWLDCSVDMKDRTWLDCSVFMEDRTDEIKEDLHDMFAICTALFSSNVNIKTLACYDEMDSFSDEDVAFITATVMEMPVSSTLPTDGTAVQKYGSVFDLSHSISWDSIVSLRTPDKHSQKCKRENTVHEIQRVDCLPKSLKDFFERNLTTFDQMEDGNKTEQQIQFGIMQHEQNITEFNEHNVRDINLKNRKKSDFHSTIWQTLNQLPLPSLSRDVIVNFFEKQTTNELKEILTQLASDKIPETQTTMKFEMLRLCTMKHFPKSNRPFAIRIIEAGFYYGGCNDQVVCYCCGSRKDNWVLEDIPLLIHQKLAPKCSFLMHNTVVNIPIRKSNLPESTAVMRLLAIHRINESITSDTTQGVSSLMPPSSEQNHMKISNEACVTFVTCESSPPIHLVSSEGQNVMDNQHTSIANINSVREPEPKYPHYAVKSVRINSFNGWPADLRQRPEEMAECGFYFAGFSDCVRCFHCGVGLRHWMSEDDPWIEHARWSTSCFYVSKMKGEEFVSLVKMAVEIAEREEAKQNESRSNQPPTNNTETSTADAVKKDSQNNTANDSAVPRESTSSTGTTCDPAGSAAASTAYPGNADVQKYLLTDAAQSVLDMGYQPKLVQRAIEKILMKKGPDEMTGQIILEAVFEIEEEGSADSKSETSSQSAQQKERNEKDFGAAEGGSGLLDPEKIRREHRELHEATLCKICLDNTSSVVFLPCGHLVTCPECAPAMRKCPICRTLIKGTVKIFFG